MSVEVAATTARDLDAARPLELDADATAASG